MSNGAAIKVFGRHCEERQRLGKEVRAAIRDMYERSAAVEAAKRSGRPSAEEAALLRASTEACVRVEHAYDAHVREHGCMQQGRSAHAAG